MSDPARDMDLERRLTRHAAVCIQRERSCSELIRFAEERAGTGPVLGGPTRDLRRETLEELADARNYLCWDHQQAVAAGDHITASGIIWTLGLVVAAHDSAIMLPRTHRLEAAA